MSALELPQNHYRQRLPAGDECPNKARYIDSVVERLKGKKAEPARWPPPVRRKVVPSGKV